MTEKLNEAEVFDNVIIGAGAAGITAAKLLSLSQKNEQNILFEQHFEPGGCAGYFARGNPKRVYDAGATQLVGVKEGELQYEIFALGSPENEKKLSYEKIDHLNFHFPDDNTTIHIYSNSQVKVTKGFLESNENFILSKILKNCNKYSKNIWNSMVSIPKFPPRSLEEGLHLIKLYFKFNSVFKLFVILFLFVSSKKFFYFLGLKNEHKKSIRILDSLLLDTAQNKMDDVPSIIGIMGISILNYGIFRLDGGMRSYFKKLSYQIKQNGLQIKYNSELRKINFLKEGFEIEILDKKNFTLKKILVKQNLYLNLTIWNILDLIDKTNPLNRKFIQDIEKKCEIEEGWGACALYGNFENNEKIPQTPWYHQIFPSEKDEELPHSIYVSVYQNEKNQSKRNFTATIHVDIKHYHPEKNDFYKKIMTQRIQNALNIKLDYFEFSSPSTFEKYTLRSKGQVGGIITRMRNLFFNPTKSLHKNNSSNLFIIGDTVFPGQGVISASMSGIIAWERGTKLKFKTFCDTFYHKK